MPVELSGVLGQPACDGEVVHEILPAKPSPLSHYTHVHEGEPSLAVVRSSAFRRETSPRLKAELRTTPENSFINVGDGRRSTNECHRARTADEGVPQRGRGRGPAQPANRARRAACPRWALRLREDHHTPPDRGPGNADPRCHPPRRARYPTPSPRPARRRPRLPATRSLPPADRARQPRVRTPTAAAWLPPAAGATPLPAHRRTREQAGDRGSSDGNSP